MINEQSPLHRAIERAGSQSNLARQIGVTQQTVSNWLRGNKGRLSGEAAVAIEQATDIHRSEFRPDLFQQP